MPREKLCDCERNGGQGSFVHNEESHHIVCSVCSEIVETDVLVATVEFTEKKSGASAVNGQFVSAATTTRFGTAADGSQGNSASRDASISAAKKKMELLANKLNLEPALVKVAQHLHLMAIDYGFVRGRKTEYVSAVCLYAACRIRSQPHMLIDFSSELQCNLYLLGQVYLKFAKRLGLNIPVIDPAIFVRRFALMLEFGDKLESVVNTTLRIIARMQRDWIVQGRRPTSVCGAALLIAARMHGFSRTKREVVALLKICDATLRQRLDEFQSTPASRLTINEFWAYDLPDESDPPTFQKQHAPALIEDIAEDVVARADKLKQDIDLEESAQINTAASSFKPATSITTTTTTTTAHEKTGHKARQRLRELGASRQQAYGEIAEELETAFVENGQGQHHALIEDRAALAPERATLTVPLAAPQRSVEQRAEERRRRERIFASHKCLSDEEDDPEVLACLLTDAERERKRAAWDAVNQKYLERHPHSNKGDAATAGGGGKSTPAGATAAPARGRKKKKLEMPDTAPAMDEATADVLATSAAATLRGVKPVGTVGSAIDGPQVNLSSALRNLFG